MNSRSLDLKKGPGKEKYAVQIGPFSQSPKAVVRAELQDSIRRRAEEIYIQSGQLPGRDLEDWMQAEREILEQEPTVDLRCAIIVKINGVKYLCDYCPQLSDGYVPGEIGRGASAAVRLKGDRMFVTRPNGKELETRIVKKIG